MKPKKKVFVGMSGGVDSSVSAALLKKEGYDVTGVFIKVWYPDWLECDWRTERRDAMRVAAHLEIPFITLDLASEYKKSVIDNMISEYSLGRTPNPDVLCNKDVKFGAFLKFALEKKADFIATGHYSKVDEVDSVFRLLESTDKEKDQSYFLWTLGQNELRHTLFPVGNLEKSEVRELARKFKIPVSEKKDSQGLCFVGKVDLKEFLGHFIKTEKGPVLDTSGKVIGDHDGSTFFTIGERHGFRIKKKSPNDGPLYVIAKDLQKNSITVAEEIAGELEDTQKLTFSSVNWIAYVEPDLSKNYSARVRYRAPLIPVKIQRTVLGNLGVCSYFAEFEKPVRAITPGQSIVFYDGDVMIGGGIIV